MIQRPNETQRIWTVEELLQMPPEQRDAILEAAALLAEEHYINDPDLIFDAYAQKGFHDDTEKSDGVAAEG